MPDYHNIHSQLSDASGNEYFVKIDDTSHLNLFMVDNVSNALTLSSAWQKIFESPKSGEPAGERGVEFQMIGRKLDFPIITNESNETALIDMFFIGHTNRLPLYYPTQNNMYPNGSTVMAKTSPGSKDVFGQSFSNVSHQKGAILQITRRMVIFELKTPDGEEVIEGLPSGSVPGLKRDDNWEYLSDTLADTPTCAFPLTNEVDPTTHVNSRKLIIPACAIEIDTNSSYNFTCSSFEVNQPTINYQAWDYHHPQDFDPDNYDGENDFHRADQIDKLINTRDANIFDLVFSYFVGRVLDWNYSWNATGIQAAHDKMSDFADSAANGTMKITIGGSSKSFYIRSDLTSSNEIDDAYIHKSFFQKRDNNNQYKKADGSPTQWKGVWGSTNTYVEGDVVAVLGGTSPLDEKVAVPFYYYVRAKKDLPQGSEKPLTADHPDPASVISGRSTSMVHDRLIPLDTEYWHCLSRNYYASPGVLSSWLGLPSMSKTFKGTDIKILGYAPHLVNSEVHLNPSGVNNKTYIQYNSNQRYFISDSVVRDFSTKVAEQTDVDLGTASAVGQVFHKFTKTIIFDSSLNIEDRLLFSIKPGDYEYHGAEGPGNLSGGGWPGKSGDPSSSYITAALFNNNYTDGSESISYPLTFAIQRIKAKGGRFNEWIESSEEQDSHKLITFSQSTEFNLSSRLPTIEIGVLGDWDSTNDTSFFWNSGEIPVRHRGVNIPVYLNPQVVNLQGEYSSPDNSNNLYSWITAVASNKESSLRGDIFDDSDGILFEGEPGNDSSNIVNHNNASIRNDAVSDEYINMVERAQSFRFSDSVDLSTYIAGTSNEILSNSIDLAAICANNSINKIADYKQAVSIKFPCNTGAAFSTKYIASLVSKNSALNKDKDKISSFTSGSGLSTPVMDGEGLVQNKSVSLINQVQLLTKESGGNNYSEEVLSDEARLDLDLASESVAKKIASEENSFLEGLTQVENEFTADYPLQYNQGRFLSNTNFHLSPIILFDQPTLEDHQNLAFHDHTSVSNIRIKEQRTSNNNRFHFYHDTASDYGFSWSINLPINEFRDNLGRVKHTYSSDPFLKLYKNQNLVKTTSPLPDPGDKLNQSIDISLNAFGGLSDNDIIGIEFYDGVPDEEDAGLKKIEAKVKKLSYPSISLIQNEGSSGTLYYYKDDHQKYKIYPNFPHHTLFGSLIRLGKKGQINYSNQTKWEKTTTISSYIEYDPNSILLALGGSTLIITLDDGAIFGTDRPRGNKLNNAVSGGSLKHPMNLQNFYTGDYTWTTSESLDNKYLINFARDVVELTVPSFESYPVNFKSNVFWVYDGTGISAGMEYHGGKINAGSWLASTPDYQVFKNASTLKSIGSGGVATEGIVLSIDQAGQIEGSFSMDSSHFPTDDLQQITLEFFDGAALLSNALSTVTQIKALKRIKPPSIDNVLIECEGEYRLWPSSLARVGSGDLTVSADMFTDSPFSKITFERDEDAPVELSSGRTGTDSSGDAVAENFSHQLPQNDLTASSKFKIQDNVNVGELIVTAPLSDSDDPLVDPELPKPQVIQIRYENESGQQHWGDMGSFPHLFNKIHPDVVNSELSSLYALNSDIERRGFLTSHVGSNIRDTYHAEMKNIIVPVNKNDKTTETDLSLSIATLGAPPNYSYYDIGGSNPSTLPVKLDVHGSRILFDPNRRGIDEPNLWTSQASVEPSQWGISSTYRGGGYSIDISPSATADLIFHESTAFLGGNAKDTPGLQHGQGVTGVSSANLNYKIWSPVNYKGVESWEEIGASSALAATSINPFHWDHPLVMNKNIDNLTFVGTRRLIGWKVSSPHNSAILGKSSCAEDSSDYNVVVIKNGCPYWGNPQPPEAWSPMDSGGQIVDIARRQTKGCIGLQKARTITKLVNGVFPGITYRLYLSLAYRGGDTDNGVSPYGPTGARVYVVEPHQAEDETVSITNELIAYGEFTPNACRSIDYNQSNMVGATGKQTNFARTDPYDSSNVKSGSVNVATGGQYNPGDPANSHSILEDASTGGFKLFYVEFTPTRGANCVEIRIENAFAGDTTGEIQPPSLWTKIEQARFFNYKWNEPSAGAGDDSINNFRKNWTEYHGAWARNGSDYQSAHSLNHDQTVLIDSVFIKPVRPLWVEKIKVKSQPAQGGFQLMLTSGDPAISPCYNYFVKAPWATGDVVNQMVNENLCSSSLDGVLNSKSTGGWFDSSEGEYELQIIRQHTHLYLWDPWGVDLHNYATVYGCQNRVVFHGVPNLVNFMPPYSHQNIEGYNVVPNLVTGNYIGHSCWWEGRLWRLKPTYQGGAGSHFIRRPGYSSVDRDWDWQSDVFQYMPTTQSALNGNSLKWDDITNLTGQQFIQDAVDNSIPGGLRFITGDNNSDSTNTGRFKSDMHGQTMSEGFSMFSQSDGFWYSGHVLDAILRRPFRSTYECYFPKWFAKNGYGGIDNSTDHLAGDPPRHINSQSFHEFNLFMHDSGWSTINSLSLFLPSSSSPSTFYDPSASTRWVYSGAQWHWFSVKSDSEKYFCYTSQLNTLDENNVWTYGFDLSPLYPYTDAWSDFTGDSPYVSTALMDPDSFSISTPLISGDDADALVGHSMSWDFAMCPGALNTYSIISSDKNNIKEPQSFPVFKYAFHRRHMSSWVNSDGNERMNPSISDHIYGSISPICVQGVADMFSNGAYYSNHSSGYAFQAWFDHFHGWRPGGYPAGQALPSGFSHPPFGPHHWIPYNPRKTNSVQLTEAKGGRGRKLII